MTVDEALGSPGQREVPPEAREAIKITEFDASYEEVFRAASVSISQAQAEIGREDKNAGLILATRTVKMAWRRDAVETTPHVFFYAISVEELGSKRTKVTIVSKIQGGCYYDGDVPSGGTTFMFSEGGKPKEECKRLAAGIWVDVYYSQDAQLSQFMVFVRNNLLAAGVL